jgi:hypothetical protein
MTVPFSFLVAAKDKHVGKKVSPDYPEEFSPGEFLLVQITGIER